MLTVVPLTSSLVDASLLRPPVEPTPENGLGRPSQAMIDLIMSVRVERVGWRLGRLEDEAMVGITRAPAVFLGIA